MKTSIETRPLTTEEKEKLRSKTNKNTIITGIFMVLVGLVGYFIFNGLEREFDIIKYVVITFYVLALIIAGYSLYSAQQDLRLGTKKVFRDIIIEKNHTITHSSSGSGNNRTTTTNHYYTFILKEQGTIKVTDTQYNDFKQDDTIQVEKLSFSGTLWNMLLVTETGETVEPATLFDKNKAFETQYQPFDNTEKEYLAKQLHRKIVWRVVYIIPYSTICFFGVAFLNEWLLVKYVPWRYSSYAFFYNVAIAGILACLWSWCNISRLQSIHQNDINQGKVLISLQLVDKETIQSGSTTYWLHFENKMRLPVSLKAYQDAETNQSYWVGKTFASNQILTIQNASQTLTLFQA